MLCNLQLFLFGHLCGQGLPQGHYLASVARDNYSKVKGHRSKSRRDDQGCLRQLAFSQPWKSEADPALKLSDIKGPTRPVQQQTLRFDILTRDEVSRAN